VLCSSKVQHRDPHQPRPANRHGPTGLRYRSPATALPPDGKERVGGEDRVVPKAGRGPRCQATLNGRWLSQGYLAIRPRWPHFGLTTPLNNAACCVAMNSIPLGQRSYGLVVDPGETLYGSEGWGLESLRARHASAGQGRFSVVRGGPFSLP
jgi:hypothetical protein